MIKKNKLKRWQKSLLMLSCVSFVSITSFSLASCSSINSSLLDQTVSKNNGKEFATNFDINKITKAGFKSDAFQKNYLDNHVNALVLDWIEYLSNTGEQINYKKALDNQRKLIDDEYSSTIEASRKNNGADFDLKFQQDELDPNGGTEKEWKQKKLLNWAKTEFLTKVFEKDYLSVVSSSGEPIKFPTKAQLISAIEGTTIKFEFSPKSIETNKNKLLDPLYADFQKFVYDNWIQIETPFIINMVLWKYGTPVGGINSVYNSDATMIAATDNTTAGNYSFPYFNNTSATNSSYGTIDKFKKFINDAANKPNYISEAAKGLIDIPKEYTDDSSTYILAKNGSIYNDLYIEFAAAANYLLFKEKGSSTPLNGFPSIQKIDQQIQKTISTTKSNGLDEITSNFVSINSINNRDIKLDKSLVDQIINPNGGLNGLTNQDLFTTDAILNSDANLNQFMFLRNEAGVHAIAIDGFTFINSATSISQFKENAGKIVLYRNFMNKYGYSSDLTIDVKSELSNFLSSNFNWLVLKYAEKNMNSSTTTIFNPKKVFGQTKIDFLTLLNNYLFDISKYNRSYDYQNKMYDAKSKFSANYGIDTKKNGFASPFVYSYVANTTNFDVANSPTVVTDPYANNGSQNAFYTAINNFVESLSLFPLSSSFSGFQYSQYILTEDFYINQALISFGSDGNSLGNTIKINILKDYLGNKIADDFKFTNTIFTSSSFNNDVENNINNALISNFFSSTFNSLSNKWVSYSKDSNVTIAYSDLVSYQKQLWKNSKEITTSAVYDDYLSLYTLMSTVSYLLNNNAQEFLNYLKSKIILGEESYVAWYQSYNTSLSGNTSMTINNLINISNNSLSKNINNTFNSAYFGQNASDVHPITNNTNNYNSLFSSDNSYYKYVSGSVGFSGIQTSNSNTASVAIAEKLFTDQSTNTMNNGLLYTYQNRQNLISEIHGYTLESDVTNLARNLQNKIKNISINSVNVATGLQAKKTALISIVNDTTNVTDQMFMPRTGYIANGGLTTTTTTTLLKDKDSSVLERGAKVIQLNTSNLNNLSSLQTAIEELFKNDTTNKDNYTSQVFFNLVIEAAMDTNIQSQALSSILTNLKVNVYDIRVNNQLGPIWASNWK